MINFPFEQMENLLVLGAPILMHTTVNYCNIHFEGDKVLF